MKKLYGHVVNGAVVPFTAYDNGVPLKRFYMEIDDTDWSVTAVHFDSERRPVFLSMEFVLSRLVYGKWAEFKVEEKQAVVAHVG